MLWAVHPVTTVIRLSQNIYTPESINGHKKNCIITCLAIPKIRLSWRIKIGCPVNYEVDYV